MRKRKHTPELDDREILALRAVNRGHDEDEIRKILDDAVDGEDGIVDTLIDRGYLEEDGDEESDAAYLSLTDDGRRALAQFAERTERDTEDAEAEARD
jgi:hypothetical protein